VRPSPRSIWRQGDQHRVSLRDIYMEQRLERATVIRWARSAQHNHTCCRFWEHVELWYRHGGGAMHITATEWVVMPPLMPWPWLAARADRPVTGSRVR
jgi:hypothetical protein